MAIAKSKKTELVSNLKTKLEKSNFVVIVHYRGMNGAQLYDLRVNLKSKDCHMKIVKNTLVNIAIKGTEHEPLSQFLKGPTAVLHCEDPVALAKVVSDTAKEIKCFEIKAGFLDNSVIKESEILNLAKLGSLEEVRASFVSKLVGVQSNFVRVVNASQSGLVALFQAKIKQQ
jgi:large subunit ribosomal protein L10